MAGSSPLEGLDALVAWVGFLAAGIAAVVVAVAATGTPGFAFTADSLTALGDRSLPRADAFNLGLMAVGLLGSVFTLRVTLAVTHPVQQAAGLVLLAATILLTIVGIFPVRSSSGIGYPAAIGVGILVTAALPLFASGEALAGQSVGAVVTLWATVLTLLAWFAWALADDVAAYEAGLAVPEVAMGLALFLWTFPATNRIRAEG